MTIKSFKPKQILVNCPPDVAATAVALKGDRSLTRYIIEAIQDKNRTEERVQAAAASMYRIEKEKAK